MADGARADGRLILVLGDQLNRDSAALEDFRPGRDVVWMAEVPREARHVPSHKARIAVFLSAMRHFRDALAADGLTLRYHALEAHRHETLWGLLGRDLQRLAPSRVVMVRAGEHRVQSAIEDRVRRAGIGLELRPDRHFLTSTPAFDAWAGGRRQVRLEDFYRQQRRRLGVLMDGDAPAGGRWNYDAHNRKAFGRRGPDGPPRPRRFPPDATTREVLALVRRRFAEHPGDLDAFDWPVTPADARAALEDFVGRALPRFGAYQDAMWRGEPWLFHSRLSSAMNLKLLDPRRAIVATTAALEAGEAPIAAVEGFVRQVLGWRELVRGIYWRHMPGLADANALDARQPLPPFYWTGETDMACLRDAIGQTLRLGYAHHIQRLMVTGLFALLLGVEPRRVHEWYLAVYVDAVEWVELPNTLGMSQYADGGLLASKPYVASGRYIQRMSNLCDGCRYDPGMAVGEDACPFTTLYWDFLMRHRARFARHPRTALQWRGLDRLDPAQRRAIRRRAGTLRRSLQGSAPAAGRGAEV